MMARVTQVYSIDEVARRIGESLELIEIISWNDDNIDYGEMRGGSGNLTGRDKWIFRATAA